MLFGIHFNTFFPWTSSYIKFSVKQAVSGISLNYAEGLHLILVIRIYLNKNLIDGEVQAARTLIKQESCL